MKFTDVKMTVCVRSALMLTLALFGLQTVRAQTLFTEGDTLSDRDFNTDTGPTNSQLTLDFPLTQAGILQNILTWGENSGSGGPSGIGESFEAFVLRPLNRTNFQVVFATGYMKVANLGTNTFAISGAPFGLHVGDVIAHYGRGIPFNNNTGGPSSVYIAVDLPPPALGTTITVPSPVYPEYNDGGRNYAIQVQSFGPPFVVTTNSDNGPGSLREEVLDSAALGGGTVSFATSLSGQTIVLTSGQIELSQNVTIDGSALTKAIQINGNNQSRVFQVDDSVTAVLNDLIITNGSVIEFAQGGGVVNYGTLTLNNCIITGNRANASDGGGGICNETGTLTVNNCLFTGNQSSPSFFSGGGICVGGDGDGGTVNLNNCTFTGNQGEFGGAIAIEEGTLNINNCTVSGNFAYGNGGGLDDGFGGTINITNSIFCSNFPNNIDTSSYSSAHNLIDTNALLAPLGNYGGPTQTMPPLAGSPAIDAGSDSTTSFLTTDQRARPRLLGTHVDIGAVEVNPSTIVTTVADNIAGSLRNVIAVTTNTDLISFAQTLSGQKILLASGQIFLTNNLTLDGSGLVSGIAIQNNSDRMLQVNNSATAVLNSLTLMNGNCSSAGGALLNEGGNLTLNNCTLSGNVSKGDGGGGAIFNDANSTLTLNQCTLTANHAFQQGGAIYNFNPTTLTAVNCTISSNISDEVSSPRGGRGGGGIFNSGTLDMINDIVVGNSDSFAANVSGPFTGANNLTSGVAVLAPLGTYGGPTQTMPPLPGSPAIDAGDDSVNSFFATDQRGYPRLSSSHVDIGAVEVQIAAAPYPVAGVTRLGNGSIQFGLTNLAGGSFTVFASTNAALPFNTWSNLGPVLESPLGSGRFQFTDPQAPNFPGRFYRVLSP